MSNNSADAVISLLHTILVSVVDSLEKKYIKFAKNGINGVSQLVAKNDYAENLLHKLLALHIDKTNLISALIKMQNCAFEEFFEILAAYPDEIKFNKQLFAHRDIPAMNLCFLHGIRKIQPVTIPLLKSHFKLTENTEYLDSIWMTMVESWYSRLDVNDLTANQMKEISEEVAEILLKPKNKIIHT